MASQMLCFGGFIDARGVRCGRSHHLLYGRSSATRPTSGQRGLGLTC